VLITYSDPTHKRRSCDNFILHGGQGPVGVRGVYIHVGLHTWGFLVWDHVDWSSIVYRFGGLHTYHNMPLGIPEAHSDSGKATLLAARTCLPVFNEL
jgi:hypothetical protein